MITLFNGDARFLPLPDRSVHCCITSPPYWGLRDYNTPDQIGLEPTPDQYVADIVACMREVWRVLRDDGTLWLVLGDSYANDAKWGGNSSGKHVRALHGNPGGMGREKRSTGLKPKDLVGIPWMVAKALQAPQYTGRIKIDTDRAWLAGFLDGEGTISFVERDRGEGHTPTHDVRVFFTNCDDAPLRHFAMLTAGYVYQHEDGERENRYGSRTCFRWQMGTHDGVLLLRELYPYLRTKRKQAALAWTLYTTLRHKNGHARTPTDIVEKRRVITTLIRSLNAGELIDLPSWIEEPPDCHEPGWYLRSDIIWSKPNPMPESVTDRPTKSHEYVFLLSKSERYFYDAEAIKENAQIWTGQAGTFERTGPVSTHILPGQAAAQHRPNRKSVNNKTFRGGGAYTGNRAFNNSHPIERESHGNTENISGTRNKRSVWTVATRSYSGAHFATFPPDLVEPMVLAGTSARGCCPACGAPWVRLSEHEVLPPPDRVNNNAFKHDQLTTHGEGKTTLRNIVTRKTVCWQPSCDCGIIESLVIPPIVLDPFAGTATVGRVCAQHGRRFIGVELNPAYIKLARERTSNVQMEMQA